MIVSIRSAGIVDGGLADGAFAWAVKVCNYINGHFEGIEIHAHRTVGGPLYEIHWISTYSSLAAFETAWAALEADEGYRGLLKEAREAGFFAAESIIDQIFRRVG